jgi:hypothetical protein
MFTEMVSRAQYLQKLIHFMVFLLFVVPKELRDTASENEIIPGSLTASVQILRTTLRMLVNTEFCVDEWLV